MKELSIKNLRELWREFLPLSMSDVTMAIGDPAVTFTMANLPAARENLSAVGAAKSLAVFFESPIIMVLHASNTLAVNPVASRLLKRFVLYAMVLLSSSMVCLTIPAVFTLVGTKIFGFDEMLAAESRKAILPLAIWPAAIAWRRYYQGLLIRAGYGGAVAQAGFGRIGILVALLATGYALQVGGASLAGVALAAGVLTEAILVTFLAERKGARELAADGEERRAPRTMKELWRFYWPLANSMVVVWGGRALLLAVISRASDASIALAVWPAAWGLVVLVSNATRMVQQVLIRNRTRFHPSCLVAFVLSVGTVCTIVLLVMAATRPGAWLLDRFVGDDATLREAVRAVVFVCFPLPLLIAVQNACQGLLVAEGRSGKINQATYLGTCVLLAGATAGILAGYGGAFAAALSMVGAILVETLWLWFGAQRGLRDLR